METTYHIKYNNQSNYSDINLNKSFCIYRMNFRHQPMGMYERIMQDRMFQQPILDHGGAGGMIPRPNEHFQRKERSPGLNCLYFGTYNYFDVFSNYQLSSIL